MTWVGYHNLDVYFSNMPIQDMQPHCCKNNCCRPLVVTTHPGHCVDDITAGGPEARGDSRGQ